MPKPHHPDAPPQPPTVTLPPRGDALRIGVLVLAMAFGLVMLALIAVRLCGAVLRGVS